MTAAAIKATWATYKPVPTRNVLQLTLEVPLEQQADVFEKLGYPVPGTEKWVGVALLNTSATEKPPSPEKTGAAERRAFSQLPLSQQAALMCERSDFQQWLNCRNADEAAEHVRFLCGVISRSELSTDAKAGGHWRELYGKFLADTGRVAEQRG